MAKLYKIERYVTDYNNRHGGVDDFLDSLHNNKTMSNVISACFKKKEVDIDFTDGSKINFNSVTREDYEVHFKNLQEVGLYEEL